MKFIALFAMLFWLALATPVVAQTPTSVRDLIYQYAVQGNVAQLEHLKKMGYSLDALDVHGNTAYCQAIWMQQRRAITTLRAAGADSRPECLKKIPVVTVDMIYDAASDGDLDQLVAWEKIDVQVDVVDSEDGNSALCKAVYAQNCKAIQTLLRAGAQEAQACMRRVPQSVRDKLSCKPIEINWDLVGYTTLGIATAGGVAALLIGSGGGGGSPTCSAEQRWQGSKCMSCDTCWLGSTCIDQEIMDSEYYYRDSSDASCWQVAPPPIAATESELEEGVARVRNGAGYAVNASAFDLINVAYAYARGYTGYIVSRSDNAGRLTYGQTSYQDVLNGEYPASVTNEKVTVAILSSGTTIGNGGYRMVTNTDNVGGSTEEITSYLPVWDWTDVNPHFYEVAEARTGQSYHKSETEIMVNRTISDVSTERDGGVGLDTSFALKDNQPFGFNYDYGMCPTGVTTNCWAPKDLNKTNAFGFYGSDSNFQYLWFSKTTAQPAGLHSEAPTGDDAEYFACYTGNDLKALADTYEYDANYVYDLNDPSPHYTITTSATARNAGTLLASIVASLYQDLGADSMHGVAYNAAILPVITDLWYPLQSKTFNAIIPSSDIILNDRTLQTRYPSNTLTGSTSIVGGTLVVDDAIGAYSRVGETTEYIPGAVANYFGTDTLNAFKALASNSIIYITPTGSSATNISTPGSVTISHSQPTLDAVIPLLNEFNTSKPSWIAAHESEDETGGALPILDDNNVLKNLFITVSAVTNVDGDNADLASYAQPCGISASYCLVAPGSLSGAPASSSSTLMSNDSTSNAAAVVAGAVALLKGAYPHLTSQQVVEILFETAHYIEPTEEQIEAYETAYSHTVGDVTFTSAGVYQETELILDMNNSNPKVEKYNSIFGRGLIDLDAATSPVGGMEGLWVKRLNANTNVTALSTSLLSTSAMSVGLSASLPSSFTAFDMYDRPFELPTSMLFKVTDKRRAKSLSDFKAFVAGRDEIVANPSENFSMSYLSRTSTQSSPVGFGLMKIQAKVDKATFGMFYSENTQKSFGSYITRKLNNPFIQMREAYGLNTGWQFNSKWSVDASWISGKNGFFDEDAMNKNTNLPDNSMQALTTSVTYRPVQPFGVKLSSGIMRENGSSLGMVSSGAFNIQGAKTYFVGAGLTFNPLDNLRFDAMYYYGQTNTQQGDGLISLGKMMSDGFALTAEYNHSDNSALGFQVSSPLRVRSGTMHVSLPVGRHPTEDIFYYKSYGVDMSPSARELDLSLYLKEQISSDVLWQTELGTRLHPDHRADAAPDYRAFMSLQWKY